MTPTTARKKPKKRLGPKREKDPVFVINHVFCRKWNSLIWWELYRGKRRNDELQRSFFQITPKVLSSHLNELEAYGVVSHTEFPEALSIVEYQLTEYGRSFAPIGEMLLGWSAREVKRASQAIRARRISNATGPRARIELLPKTIDWVGGLDGFVRMVDQTRLPGELVYLDCRDVETMWEAIKVLRVRGAPAIGVAAAMGLVLGVRDSKAATADEFFVELRKVSDYLASSRPTAVNLTWALDRQRRIAKSMSDASIAEIKEALLAEAKKIRDEDEAMCREIGRHGESLIANGAGVLTHCNAGSLATAYYGTALAPMFTAHEKGRRFRVFADETRPLLQGARLTVWELMQAGIDATLLCDSMAASLMKQGKVNLVITGADRIAANGDTANKIGTYGLAVLAKAHNIPFYVAAPTSTFDLSIPEGSLIPIEERSADEIRKGFGSLTAPPNAPCYCPAFDVTPASLIQAIITERGIISPVSDKTIKGKIGPSSA